MLHFTTGVHDLLLCEVVALSQNPLASHWQPQGTDFTGGCSDTDEQVRLVRSLLPQQP